MKILFSAPNCLLDPSSGASISCRIILEGLAAREHSVTALSACIFDAPRFSKALEFLQHIRARETNPATPQHPGIWQLKRNLVNYIIMPSPASRRMQMTCSEEVLYQNTFKSVVENIKPDVVLAYGGWFMEKDSYRWLKDQNIPSVFYLANPRYTKGDTFRDLSLIISDSEATADLYKKRLGLTLHPLGKFVTPVKLNVGAQRDCVTFINPSAEKGATVFIGILREAQRRGLSAQFLVVESKAQLGQALQAQGLNAADFSNITYLPMQEDMNKVWSRTRVLLSPSLWHESGPRTIVEACSAGIPVLSTDSGGAPEFLGDIGYLFPVPSEVKDNFLNPIASGTAREWTDVLEKLLSDDAFYRQARERAGKRWQVLRQGDSLTKLEKLLEGILPH